MAHTARRLNDARMQEYIRNGYISFETDLPPDFHAQVRQRLAFMRDDRQDPSTYGDWYLQVRNPVFHEGLVQLTMGGPLFTYNGGLLQVALRYFDAERRRPGLPGPRTPRTPPDTAPIFSNIPSPRAAPRVSPAQSSSRSAKAGV